MTANSRLEQFKALAYDALPRRAVQISPLPGMQTAVCTDPAPGVLLLALLPSGPNPQVAQGAPRQELRNPPSAVPKVKGSRVGCYPRSRQSSYCETPPTITEVGGSPRDGCDCAELVVASRDYRALY